MYFSVEPDVIAFSSTRHGGCGQGNYSSFNVNPYCGDIDEHVFQNKRALCNLLKIDVDHLVFPHQVHGVETLMITQDFLKQSVAERKRQLEGVDALITSEKGICIAVSTADCVPVILYDIQKKIAAVVHAGWRGTVSHITERVVCQMQKAYGVHPKDIKAVIGPSIGVGAFEVGQEVYDAFEAAGFPMSEVATKMKGKWHINLWASNQWLLQGVGVQKIYISGVCTYENAQNFFSARKLTIESGRILSGIMIKQ